MLMTLVVQVENKPGVLNRVASLFRRRGFNIESLTVGHTEKTGVSRMTIVVDTDEAGALRIEANLYKLVHVQRVENVTATPETRAEIMQLAHVFRARIVDVNSESLVIETTGTEDKIDGLVEILRGFGILEMARTGRVAMTRGPRPEASAGASGQDDSLEDESVSYSV